MRLSWTSSIHPGKEEARLFEYKETDGVVIFSPTGNINEKTAIEFKENLLVLLAQKKFSIILDLEQVGYVTSLGIGVLCDIKKRLDIKNGWIKIAHINDDLMEIFRFTMMTDIFNIYPTVEQALADR